MLDLITQKMNENSQKMYENSQKMDEKMNKNADVISLKIDKNTNDIEKANIRISGNSELIVANRASIQQSDAIIGLITNDIEMFR